QSAYPQQVIELRCPSIQGLWDRDRLEQVFSNLIGNAVLYGDSRRPITVVAAEEGGLVLVDVHNEGDPIPVDLQKKLFDPFRRGERDSRTAKTEGLGLGLYISNEIAHAHRGKIDVRSNREEGTTFRVTLPLR